MKRWCAVFLGFSLFGLAEVALGQGTLSQTFLRRYNLDAMQGGLAISLKFCF